MVAEVGDEPDDIVGYEPPHGAAGVGADEDPPAGVEHEPGELQVQWVGVDERAGQRREAGASALWPTGNCRPCFVIRAWVVASSSTDSATTLASTSARLSCARWKARSCALQYGHHDPR